VADLCNDLLLGTVTSPGSGTFVCAESGWVKSDDYFNDWVEVFCYAGTGVGTSGNPTDWVNSTTTLTFEPAATLTAGDSVEMHRTFDVALYNRFINQAIDMVAGEALVDYVDTSIDLVASTYQYALPTNFLYVKTVEYESSTSGLYDSWKPIDNRHWRIVKGSTIYLELVKELYGTPVAGRELRITGFASPATLSADTQECPINPYWVANQAAAMLHRSRIRGNNVDDEYHIAQAQICQAEADKIRPEIRTSIGAARPVVEA